MSRLVFASLSAFGEVSLLLLVYIFYTLHYLKLHRSPFTSLPDLRQFGTWTRRTMLIQIPVDQS